VNAPFTCPNSSLSISSSGIAAQLTSTKGPARRRLSAWMHREALAHHRQALVHVGAERAVLDLELPLSHCVADHQDRLVQRQGLLDEIERTHLDRTHCRLDVAVAGDHDHRRIHTTLPETGQRREAVDAGEPDVEDDHVVRRPGHTIETGLAAVDGIDDVALVAQHARERTSHARLVVHYEYGRFHNPCIADSLIDD
jgi:hypothetical protein